MAGRSQQAGNLRIVLDFCFSPDQVALATRAEVAVHAMGGGGGSWAGEAAEHDDMAVEEAMPAGVLCLGTA